MRTRLAITAMLVVGFALSGAGAGLAVSGISGDDSSSSSAEYSQPPTTPPTTTTTETTTTTATTPLLPTTQTPPPASGQLGEQDQGEAPEETTPAETPEEEATVAQPQESRQVGAETGGDELPFTGWAAIPVLLIGLGLVGAGLTLRRGLSKQS